MHSATIFFAMACVAAASAGGAVDIYAVPNYKTSYAVSDKLTGDQKSAAEVRQGDVTKGSYSLLQPDGVVRTVNYIVTPLGGFQAQVLNNGVAAHPAIIGKNVGISAIAAPGLALGAGRVGLAGPGLALGAGNLGLGLGGLGGASSVVGLAGSPLAGAGGLGLRLGLNSGLGLGLGLNSGLLL